MHLIYPWQDSSCVDISAILGSLTRANPDANLAMGNERLCTALETHPVLGGIQSIGHTTNVRLIT